nr:zinc finger protein 598 [Ipomoea batatas]GME10519.1 zinc finger protein 598 [Ipomoea batatas]
MDDTCAVCAETLEWVAYGACGHKDVCSTCVARLRFICDDRRCCICKTENSIVFVTKAMGDYTRIISDFAVFPPEPKEGRAGSYWYHEGIQAFFDDSDHYKMIRAMCRLSCSVCDRMEEQSGEGPKRRGKFRNIEQLKGHLFHQHRLLMCSLCLEGRKVFICEQKLYTRAQLNQHINSGDSEVDGTESERGGFMGHPMCEFCRTPFYGDNELYSHMSTEHYTCHICQRQNPGQYEYYKNYDDLEMHFRGNHFLCEDESCLSKKFIVFQSEAELKRHNALEHGGRMSRSKRNAALQLPTSFRYRRSNDQDGRRGRGRTFRRDSSDAELSMAIQASLEMANSDRRLQDASSSSARVVPDHAETSDFDPLVPQFELSTNTDSVLPSRYRQALSQSSRNAPLVDSSFPPLPMAPGGSLDKSECLPMNTMAAHLRQENKKSALGKPAASRTSTQHATTQRNSWPVLSSASGSASSFGSKQAAENVSAPAISHQHAWPSVNSAQSTSVRSKQSIVKGPTSSGNQSSSQSRSVSVQEITSTDSFSSMRNQTSSNGINHSTSVPNRVENGSFDSSSSVFPPVSVHKLPGHAQATEDVKDVHTANKSLVGRIQAALDFDQDKYAAFKNISAEYRNGVIDAVSYLAYVDEFGLSNLVPELARLCPDSKKQKELIETYNTNLGSFVPEQNGRRSESPLKGSNGFNKGKGKGKGKETSIDAGEKRSKEKLADDIINTAKKLQSSIKLSEEEVEVLSKDGYRGTKGKSKVIDDASGVSNACSKPLSVKTQNDSLSDGGVCQNLGDGDRRKQKKKTSKFIRVRLGDGSAEALLNLRTPNPADTDFKDPSSDGHSSSGSLPVQGVWRSGGVQRLFKGA